MRWVGLLPVVAACGRIGFDDRARPGGDDGTRDASIGAVARCDSSAAFGVPLAITELDDPDADDGAFRLRPDELSGYFWSYRDGIGQIYLATRTSTSDRFAMQPVHGLAYTNELEPTVDGTLMLFRRDSDVWLATQIDPDEFAAPTMAAALSSPGMDAQPFLQADGSAVYFASDRGGTTAIYRAHRDGVAFDVPELVGELASIGAVDSDPVVSADGLTIYFRSDRAASLAGGNIYVATRASTAESFGAPMLVANVNSDADEGPSWISPDGCRLYLWSDRGGTSDLYIASR